MTTEQLAAIAGLILSLLVAYIPPVANWYNTFDAPGKARVMAGLLVLTAIGVFAYGCIPQSLVPCTVAGAKELIGVLIAALVANQATFSLLVHPFKKTPAAKI